MKWPKLRKLTKSDFLYNQKNEDTAKVEPDRTPPPAARESDILSAVETVFHGDDEPIPERIPAKGRVIDVSGMSLRVFRCYCGHTEYSTGINGWRTCKRCFVPEGSVIRYNLKHGLPMELNE